MRTSILSAALFAMVATTAAMAQQSSGTARPPDLSAMSCDDYLKAEQGAQWSEGKTGQPALDNQVAFDPVKVHDFCTRNTGARAAEALQNAKTP